MPPPPSWAAALGLLSQSIFLKHVQKHYGLYVDD